MINKIWCFFIIISIIFSIITGNLSQLNESFFSSINDTVYFVINLFGSMCFWCGIMKIISETTIQEKIKKFILPLNKIIFKNLDPKSKAYEFVSINIITNMLGIGNAATPTGLKAVEEMEKLDKNEISDDMLLFITINTASIQIIPTNLIAIRSSLSSNNPSIILPGIWFSSIMTFISIIFLTKLYLKIRRK